MKLLFGDPKTLESWSRTSVAHCAHFGHHPDPVIMNQMERQSEKVLITKNFDL